MTVITTTDLNNAKIDVDHIAAIATSTALTATDRVGNTKRTIAGMLDVVATAEAQALIDIPAAVALIDQEVAETAAGSATAAYVAALALFDGVISIPSYASKAAGVSAVADGAAFTVDLATGWKMEYRRTGSDAIFIRSYPGVGAALVAKSFIDAASQAQPRPAYEYPMSASRAFDGRFVPNTGFNAAIGSPVLNALGAWGLMLDGDGSYTTAKIVNDPEVIDPLGFTESVTLTFTAANQVQTLLQRTQNPDFPATNLSVSALFKQKGAAVGSLQIGPSSDFSGFDDWRLNFSTTGEWVERTILAPNYSPSVGAEICIRPAVGATFPFSVSVYGASIFDPTAGAKPSLAALRAARLAGHAYAPLALPGAVQSNALGGFVPSNRTFNLVAETGLKSPITKHAFSAWVNSESLPTNSVVWAAGFANAETVSEVANIFARIGMDAGASAVDRHGRLRFAAPSGTDNLDASEYSPSIAQSGWTHVHVNFGHNGTDIVTAEGTVAMEVLIDGLPLFERTISTPAAHTPKLLTIGAYEENSRKPMHRSLGMPVELVRFEPGVKVSRAEVLERVRNDRKAYPNLRKDLSAMIMFEGDSTDQFRGSPGQSVSKSHEKKGRLFLNHARPGSWFQGGIASNSDYIGTGQRRKMRLEALAGALSIGYRKILTVWRPGENDQNANAVWSFAANKSVGLQTLTNFILDDLESVDPTRERSVSVFSTMKQSYWTQPEGFANVEAIWAAVDAIYTEQVDPINAPYLYRAPTSYTGRKHDYVIKLHLWAPNDGVTAFPNWQACALDAGGVTHATIAAAQTAALAGTGERWHSTPGWVRLTGNPSGSQYYKRRASEPAGIEKFSVNHKGTTTLWYEQVPGTAAPANGIISSDGQHFTAPWSPYIGDAVFGPSLLRVLEIEGVS